MHIVEMSWRERLYPHMSKMHREVAISLQLHGVNFRTDITYVLKLPEFHTLFMGHTEVPTEVDFEFRNYWTVAYIDGKAAHKNRQEKDQFLRQLLREQYPVTVLEYEYDRYTKTAKQQIVHEILQALK